MALHPYFFLAREQACACVTILPMAAGGDPQPGAACLTLQHAPYHNRRVVGGAAAARAVRSVHSNRAEKYSCLGTPACPGTIACQ